MRESEGGPITRKVKHIYCGMNADFDGTWGPKQSFAGDKAHIRQTFDASGFRAYPSPDGRKGEFLSTLSDDIVTNTCQILQVDAFCHTIHSLPLNNRSIKLRSIRGRHRLTKNLGLLVPNGAVADASANAMVPLVALCTVARFHQVAADPATLAHQLGLSSSDGLTATDLLRAAQHLGLRAKLTKTSVDRLALTPLPALALMHTHDGALRVVILAQSDGQRVLFQEVTA